MSAYMPGIFWKAFHPDAFRGCRGSIWAALGTGSGYVAECGTSAPPWSLLTGELAQALGEVTS